MGVCVTHSAALTFTLAARTWKDGDQRSMTQTQNKTWRAEVRSVELRGRYVRARRPSRIVGMRVRLMCLPLTVT